MQGEKGPALMFGGTSEGAIQMTNVYMPLDTSYSGGSQFLYPIQAAQLLGFSYTGDVENYHSFLDLTGFNSYDLDVYPHIGALSAGTGAGHDIITLESNGTNPTGLSNSRIFPEVGSQSVAVKVIAEAGTNTTGLQDSIIYVPPSTTLALSHGSNTNDLCYGGGTCSNSTGTLRAAQLDSGNWESPGIIGNTTPSTVRASTLFVTTGAASAPAFNFSTVYSAAGTPVPVSCTNDNIICTSDTTTCTNGTSYTSGGSVRCMQYCASNAWKATGAGC